MVYWINDMYLLEGKVVITIDDGIATILSVIKSNYVKGMASGYLAHALGKIFILKSTTVFRRSM